MSSSEVENDRAAEAEELERLREELDRELQRNLRLRADLDNFRKA